ncbi:MAG: aminotransferase class III-fold pyridoxal phosphate-dependent enzyme [Pseudomonadota bacterium]
MLELGENFRNHWIYDWANAEDLRVIQRDRDNTLRQAHNHPALLAIESAQGSHVVDRSGRRYLDLHGNNCHHIGHRHPLVIEALVRQLGQLSFNTRGFTNSSFVALAERLASLWPGRDGRVFLTPGGAAAVELALSLARVHSGRHKIIAFEDCYHGQSLGAMSLATPDHHGSPRLGPLLPGVFHVPSYKPSKNSAAETFNDPALAARRSMEKITESMEQNSDIACLIGETIANGGYHPPPWFWPEVEALCRQHSVLLILDEIPTGLGKTGAFFNSSHFSLTPDITVIGKALGGAAMPVAAVVASAELDSAPELGLGYYTHEKNPLMACAALTTIGIIQDEKLPERSLSLGAELLEDLKAIQNRYGDLVRMVRGTGLILSLDFAEGLNRGFNEPSPAQRVFYRCLEKGLILNYAGAGPTVALSFPLNVDRADANWALEVLADSFAEVALDRP